MISESVIIFGVTGDVVMVINGALPKNAPIMFKVGTSRIDLLAADNVVYTEKNLSVHTCNRLKEINEIGLLEVVDQGVPPKHLTNIAYQAAY